ncbi:MAG TPA: hypothetical protein VJH22_01815 [Candidatus Nanoarchaeia archaeon]|nr:hypothetical protein [Candidatus Nanoarchaeia archaeon]
MDTKTIKISEDNYRWLMGVAGEIQQREGRSISIDKALSRLRRRPLSDLSGKWKGTDKEADEIKKKLSKGWAWKIGSF